MRRVGAVVVAAALAAAACSDAGGVTGAGTSTPSTTSTVAPPGTCEAVGSELVPAFQAFVDLVDDEQLTSTPPLPTLVDMLLTAAVPRSNLTAFIDTDAEAEVLATEAAAWEGVLDLSVVTKEGALEEARQMFAEDPDLLAVVEREPEVLPASVRLDVAEEHFDGLAARLRSRPEVLQVNELKASEILARVLPSRTVELVAMLLPGTDGQALGGTIRAWTGVAAVATVTQTEALETAREVLEGDPDLLAALEADPGILPASLRIEVDRAHAADVHRRLARETGVAFLQPPGVPAEWARGAELVPFVPIVRAAAPAVLAANQLGCDTGELAPVVAAGAAELRAATPAGRAFIERLGTGE